MVKRKHTKNGKSKKSSKGFWNKEYEKGDHLKLSTEPSSDMLKFFKWAARNDNLDLTEESSVTDIGCGNGRNLNHIASEIPVHGFGCDTSATAIDQARKALPVQVKDKISYAVQSISEPLPLPDESQDLVLDMMVSHYLLEADRVALLKELRRIIKPGGWLLFKTFLLNGDKNAGRLLHQYPGPEEYSYIHPKIGVLECVFPERYLKDLYGEYFEVMRTVKSHGHLGPKKKRRSVSIYLQKNF